MNLHNWKAYLCEFIGTGLFLFAGLAGIYLANLATFPIAIKCFITGFTFASAIIIITYSFLGKISGGHINPAVTFAFWMSGLMESSDTVFYIIAQLAGAFFGSSLAFIAFNWNDPRITLTLPNTSYPIVSILLVEATITFLLITLIFSFLHSEKYGPFAGIALGLYTMLAMTFFIPISGASMNPARSFGPALSLFYFKSLWIYVIGPILGAMMTVYLFKLAKKGILPKCSKLCYKTGSECLFKCKCIKKVVSDSSLPII